MKHVYNSVLLHVAQLVIMLICNIHLSGVMYGYMETQQSNLTSNIKLLSIDKQIYDYMIYF